jgi:glucose-6-phosphate dehydrogenase assembly protein OpcA
MSKIGSQPRIAVKLPQSVQESQCAARLVVAEPPCVSMRAAPGDENRMLTHGGSVVAQADSLRFQGD